MTILRSKTNQLTTITLAATLISVASVLSQTPSPSSEEATWTDLTDQPSRTELFELMGQSKELTPGPPSFNIPMAFVFPKDAITDAALNKPRENCIFGIDISHHEGSKLDLAFSQDRKVQFVYLKATQGTNYKDPTFDHYWNLMAEMKPNIRPLRGAYHFMSATQDPEEQATRFVKYVALHGNFQPSDLPPCIDLEWDVTSSDPKDKWQGQPPKLIVSKVLKCLKKAQELTGRVPVLYTSRAWWLDRNIPESEFSQLSDFPIWVADYAKADKILEKPRTVNNRKPSLWQFTDRAVFGEQRLDASIFYGTRVEFLTSLGVKQ